MSANLVDQLVLSCHECKWTPPEDAVMEAVQLHFQVEHDTDKPHMDLNPKCKCGYLMERVSERPTGGGVKVYFECPNCEQTGWIKSGTRSETQC